MWRKFDKNAKIVRTDVGAQVSGGDPSKCDSGRRRYLVEVKSDMSDTARIRRRVMCSSCSSCLNFWLEVCDVSDFWKLLACLIPEERAVSLACERNYGNS